MQEGMGAMQQEMPRFKKQQLRHIIEGAGVVKVGKEQREEAHAGAWDGGPSGLVLGVRGTREGEVRGEDRASEPPDVQDASGRRREPVRVQQRWPYMAPLRRSFVLPRAGGDGVRDGAR